MMKIIVTGSLGHIGRPLTEELVRNGHAVVVISSNPEKKQEIVTLGATAAIGSLEDAGFLQTVFSGADAVFAMIPPNYRVSNSRTHYRNIGNSYQKALQQSGVKRVVQLSSWGADLNRGTGVILGSHDVEVILNTLDEVAITFLRPTSFFTNWFSYIDMIKGAGIIGTNYSGKTPIAMVHYKDIAAAAAEELVRESTGIDIRYVSSDEVTPDQVAQVLGNAIGKPDLKWICFTDTQTLESLEKNGVPYGVAADLVALNSSIGGGALRADYDLHLPKKMGTIKLTDFANEFAAVYSGDL